MNFFNKEPNQKWWRKPKPSFYAGTAKEWHDWEIYFSEKYPIHKFISDVKIKIRVKFMRIKDIKWWFIYRFHPSHRYNIVKIGPPGYYEYDERMLRAVMQIIVDFTEGESIVDWESDPEHSFARKEMLAIREWWLDRPNRESRLPEYPKLPKELGFMAPLNEDYSDYPELQEWKRIADIHNKAEVSFHEEDQEMLIRAIKIRKFLWE